MNQSNTINMKMEITTSKIEICPIINKAGARRQDKNGTNDNTFKKIDPSNTPAMIDK